jgi:hypothetical protein
MVSFRILLLLLSVALCGAEAVALARNSPSRPLILARQAAATPVAASGSTGATGAFEGTMTPDDVARGLWALGDGGPGLSTEQRASLAGSVEKARTLRAKVADLRQLRRSRQDRWLADGAALAEALGSTRTHVLSQGGRP